MSTYFNDIQAALDTRLNSLTGGHNIGWEFTPADFNGANYLRPTFLPAAVEQASLGDTGKDLYNGLYQVDVFFRKGTGRSTIPDEIGDHFKRGTILTYNGISLRVLAVSIESSSTEDNYHVVPVTINWEVFTPPRS